MRLIPIIATMLLTVGAQAQTIVINPRPPTPPVPARAQRVTVNITVVSAVPVGTGANDLTSSFIAANQGLYSVVDHQCDVLAPLLHGQCHLISMTTNGNSNDRPNFGAQSPNPVVSVTANAVFELDPPPAPPVVR